MWQSLCPADEVGPEQIKECRLTDGAVAVAVRDSGGAIRVLQGICPHQRRALAEGDLHDDVLTCSAHMWAFDVRSGEGVQGAEAGLAVYPSRVQDGEVQVDPSAITQVTLWT